MRPPVPFLSGPPSFQVGLRPIPLTAWLQPDWEAHTLPEKRALLAEQLDAVYRAAPGSDLAAAEAARLVGADSLPAAAALVSDDLVVLERQADAWRVTSLVLCAPTFFSAAEAIGRSLAELHGPVPAPDPAFANRIARVFEGLRPDLILERQNWTVQPGGCRYTPAAAPVFAAANQLTPSELAATLHLRVERQTIRRLPECAGVVFTIRVSLSPLGPLLQDSAQRTAFAAAWAGAPEAVRRYKRWPLLDGAVATLLRAAGQERA